MPAFDPPRYLRHHHLQSVLPTLFPWRLPVLWRSRALRAAARPLLVQVDDGTRLLTQCSMQDSERPGNEPGKQPEKQPWVLILHGWLGDADSSYVLSLAARLYAAGYSICRLNLRDHGGTEHLNQGIFHSCLIDEVVSAVRNIQQRFAITELSLAGFSLGGNFALRVAARATAAGIHLHKVLAICPALNPHASDAALAAGPSLYREYFLGKWKKGLQRKQQLFPQHYRFKDVLDIRSITTLTDTLVRRHANFTGAPEYYDGYSLLGKALRTVDVPCYLLLAQDDPIVPVSDVSGLAPNTHLHITVSEYGGHCGFMSSLSGKRWADDWALQCLQHY